jgi:2'-5' RNA ligase
VDGDDRIRLFCALRLPPETVERLAAWQGEHVRVGRPVVPDNLHVTLAFLGHRPAAERPAVVDALHAAAAGHGRPALVPRRYRETRSVGMIVLDDLGGRATALAADLHARLEAAGVYRRERRPWLPHVTVVRFGGRPPRLRPPLPDLGETSPSDAGLYHSVLRSGGAQYVLLDSVALGG